MIDVLPLRQSFVKTPSKIVMLVVDGLGGLRHPQTRLSELETARMPNLNRLAQQSACGLTLPVLPGVTPGSGPGHLALFGYDPLKYIVGRGVLEAMGIDVELQQGDVAARGNFCTVDANGNITDRRAGRIESEESAKLCQLLNSIKVKGADLKIYPVKEHRFVLLLRGKNLSDQLSESDPQQTGVPPLTIRALYPKAGQMASIVNDFVRQASVMLKDQKRGSMVLLRGFSKLPSLPSLSDVCRLDPAAIAAYPMYRGLAKAVGMKVLPTGTTFAAEVETLAGHFASHDFFFIHYKPADAAGEDGDFEAKVKALENLDKHIPSILALKPDVLIVAGDHATPSLLAAHGWQPVPILIHSRWTLGEGVEGFNEAACARGSLGLFPAMHVLLQAMAHASKLTKFGA